MRRLLLPSLSLALVMASGCDRPTTTAPTAPARQQIVLAPGQTTAIIGSPFVLRFDGVVNDSRCPGDATCITAGDAVVAVSVLTATSSQAYELHTAQPKSFVYDDFTIALEQLDPYPFVTRPIAPGDYRATLVITR